MKGNDYFLFHQIESVFRYKMTKALEEIDLRPGQVGILFMIHKCGELSQNQLASCIGVTAPSMTAAIRKLEKKNFIIRQKDEVDRRITRITLSEEGKDCLKVIKKYVDDMEEQLYSDFSQEEKAVFQKLLRRATNNLLEDEDFRGKGLKEIMELTYPKKAPTPKEIIEGEM